MRERRRSHGWFDTPSQTTLETRTVQLIYQIKSETAAWKVTVRRPILFTLYYLRLHYVDRLTDAGRDRHISPSTKTPGWAVLRFSVSRSDRTRTSAIRQSTCPPHPDLCRADSLKEWRDSHKQVSRERGSEVSTCNCEFREQYQEAGCTRSSQ